MCISSDCWYVVLLQVPSLVHQHSMQTCNVVTVIGLGFGLTEFGTIQDPAGITKCV